MTQYRLVCKVTKLSEEADATIFRTEVLRYSLKKEAVDTTKSAETFYQTVWCHDLEDIIFRDTEYQCFITVYFAIGILGLPTTSFIQPSYHEVVACTRFNIYMTTAPFGVFMSSQTN